MCLNVSKLCLIKSQIYVSKFVKIFGGSEIWGYGWSRHNIMGGHYINGWALYKWVDLVSGGGLGEWWWAYYVGLDLATWAGHGVCRVGTWLEPGHVGKVVGIEWVVTYPPIPNILPLSGTNCLYFIYKLFIYMSWRCSTLIF